MKHFMLYLLYPTTFFVMSPSGQCNMFQKKVIFYLISTRKRRRGFPLVRTPCYPAWGGLNTDPVRDD